MSTDFRIELACCTSVLLAEIEDRAFKQADIAQTYALAMNSSGPTDWAKVNAAIISRWSRSGLVRVKNMAHKIFETRRRNALTAAADRAEAEKAAHG